MPFRKAQIEIIPGHTVVVDAEDAERIQARTWKQYPGERINTAQVYRSRHTCTACLSVIAGLHNACESKSICRIDRP